jgi:excisionase family DNA binding protein
MEVFVMKLLTVTEFAKEIKFSPYTTRKMIRERRVPFHKIGGKYFFTESDLESFIKKCAISVEEIPQEAVV